MSVYALLIAAHVATITPARLLCEQETSASACDAADPLTVAKWTSIAYGIPSLETVLVRICMRESRCEAISVHEGDRRLAFGGGWYGQVRLGHLDPACQPLEAGPWSTRGAWGLSAASHWHYLPACYQPSVLDDPWVSADVAARKVALECDGGRKRGGWCG